MNKKDILLILCILFLAIVLFFINSAGIKKGSYITVSVDGVVVDTFSLTEDMDKDILLEDGSYNHIRIKNGIASVTDADCPDKICVHQKGISKQGESIICMPHKMIITAYAKKEAEYDSVAN